MWTWLAGCLSDAEVAAAMEGGIATANDALAVALIATELRSQAHEPPSPTTTPQRHATTCGCPCRTRVGDGDVFVLSLDYHPEGCLPTSGLVGGGLSGIVLLEVDGDAVRANLGGGGVGGAALSGTLRGPVAGERVVSRGAIAIGDRSFALDLTTRWDGARVLADGAVTVDGAEVWLDGVLLDPAGLADECPTPERGAARVDAGPAVDLAWEGGSVTAAVRGRSSEATDPCRYASSLY